MSTPKGKGNASSYNVINGSEYSQQALHTGRRVYTSETSRSHFEPGAMTPARFAAPSNAQNTPRTAGNTPAHVARNGNNSHGVTATFAAYSPAPSAPASAAKPRPAVGGASIGVTAAMGGSVANTPVHNNNSNSNSNSNSNAAAVTARTPGVGVPATHYHAMAPAAVASRVTAGTPGLLAWREGDAEAATRCTPAAVNDSRAAAAIATADASALRLSAVQSSGPKGAAGGKRGRNARMSMSLDDMSVVTISDAFAKRAGGLASNNSCFNSSAFAATLQQHTVGGGLARAGAAGARFKFTATATADGADTAPAPSAAAVAAAADARAREGFSVADIGQGRGYGHGGLARPATATASAFELTGYARPGTAAAAAATAAASLAALSPAANASATAAEWGAATTSADLGRTAAHNSTFGGATARPANAVGADPAVVAAQEGTWMGVQPSAMRALWGAMDTSHLGNHARHHRLLAAWAAQRSRMEAQTAAYNGAVAAGGSPFAVTQNIAAATLTESGYTASGAAGAAGGSGGNTTNANAAATLSSARTAPSVPYDIIAPHAAAVAPPSAASAAAFAVAAQRDPVTGSKKGLGATYHPGATRGPAAESAALVAGARTLSGTNLSFGAEASAATAADSADATGDVASGDNHKRLAARLGKTTASEFTANFLRAGGSAPINALGRGRYCIQPAASGADSDRNNAGDSGIVFADGVDPSSLTVSAPLGSHRNNSNSTTAPTARPPSAIVAAAQRSRNAAMLDSGDFDVTLTTPASLAAESARSALAPAARAAAAAAPAAGVARCVDGGEVVTAKAAAETAADAHSAPFGTAVNAQAPATWQHKTAAAVAALRSSAAAASNTADASTAQGAVFAPAPGTAAACGRETSRVVQQILAAAARDPITGQAGPMAGTDAEAAARAATTGADRAGSTNRPYDKLVQRIFGVASENASGANTADAAAVEPPFALWPSGSANGGAAAAKTPAKANAVAAGKSTGAVAPYATAAGGSVASPAVRAAAQTALRDSLARADTVSVYRAPVPAPLSEATGAALRGHTAAYTTAPAPGYATASSAPAAATPSGKSVFASAFNVADVSSANAGGHASAARENVYGSGAASSRNATPVKVGEKAGYKPLFKPVSAWRVQNGAVVNVAANANE